MKRVVHLVAVSTLFASALAAATLNLVPSQFNVMVGDTLTLNVNVADVIDLYAYQFDIGFDPGLLNASTVTMGPFLGTGGTTFFIPGVADNLAGVVSATAESLQSAVPGVSGSGTLAQLTFVAVGRGSAVLSPFAASFLDSSLAGIAATTPSVTVVISNVPEPSSGTFVAGALLLLTSATAWVRRRRP